MKRSKVSFFKVGKASAQSEQFDRDDWNSFWGTLVISLISLLYFGALLIPLTEGNYVFCGWVSYSEFTWWAWPLFCFSILIGLGSLWQLFTEYWDKLLAIIVCIAVVGVGAYFLFY